MFPLRGAGPSTVLPERPVSGPRRADGRAGRQLKGYRLLPIHASATLSPGVRVSHPDLVNIYGCVIGADTRIGPFVEIQAGSRIGERCKIQSHAFICEGVTIEDEVFVGHGVMFTNDRHPRATDDDGVLLGSEGWTLSTTRVGARASIGSGAVLLPVEIGADALVGAGAVVTADVPPFAIVAGNPARVVGDTRRRKADPRKGPA